LGGLSLLWPNQPEEARQHWEEALRLRTASLGEKHPETLWWLTSFARLFLEPDLLNRPAEGLPLLEKAYRYSAEVLGESHPLTLDRLDELTEAYITPISTERNSATLRDKISQFLLGRS
jgi:hypothetical protein